MRAATTPPRAARHVDGRRRGHLDNSLVPWIVLVLAAVAAASLYRMRTGRSWTTIWSALPPTWRSLVVVTLALAVVGAAAVGYAARAGRGRALRAERLDGRTVVRLADPGLRTLGLLLVALAADLVGHSVVGSGLLWWGVALLGVLAGFAGAAVIGSGERVVVEPGRVALEATFMGRPTRTAERRFDPRRPPPLEVVTGSTGGAFGQPYAELGVLKVDGEVIYQGSPERAEAIREAVAKALTAGR